MNYKQLLIGVLVIAVLTGGAYFIFGSEEKDEMHGEGPWEEFDRRGDAEWEPRAFDGEGERVPPPDGVPRRDGTGRGDGTGPRDGSGMGASAALDVESVIEAEVDEPLVEEAAAVESPAVDDGGYTLAQVALHKSEEDCWTAIRGTVYDLTAFFGKHPGGDKNLFRICGIDGTAAFERKHGGDEKPETTLAGFEIGVLVQ